MLFIRRLVRLEEVGFRLHRRERAAPENVAERIRLLGFDALQELARASRHDIDLDAAFLFKLLDERIDERQRMRAIDDERIVIAARTAAARSRLLSPAAAAGE